VKVIILYPQAVLEVDDSPQEPHPWSDDVSTYTSVIFRKSSFGRSSSSIERRCFFHEARDRSRRWLLSSTVGCDRHRTGSTPREQLNGELGGVWVLTYDVKSIDLWIKTLINTFSDIHKNISNIYADCAPQYGLVVGLTAPHSKKTCLVE